jgi:hypothetical protein
MHKHTLLLVCSICCAFPGAYSQNVVGSQADSKDGQQKTPTKSAATVVSKPRFKLDLPDSGALWYRYYQAGEDAAITKHDEALAKKYYLAALAEIEQHPPVKGADMFLGPKLSALEVGLMDEYPKDWSRQGDSEEVMTLRKEQVDVYERIARINEYFAPPDDLLRIKAKERYENLKKDYEKALAVAKAKQPRETDD